MKKILMKINEVINKGKFPFAVLVIGLPNVLIIKNTGYEFTSRNGNEIITKTIEAKYFYILVVVYIIYILISVVGYVIDLKETKEKKSINITFIFIIMLMVYLIFIFLKNYKILFWLPYKWGRQVFLMK